MCTLTVVPRDSGTPRLAFNRDEKRTRAPGEPPRVRAFGARAAVLPIDPLSGGTWIAVNDAGLALAVLNANPIAPPREGMPTRSRGAIIPALLESDSPSAALARCERELDLRDFAPFRLAVVGQGVIVDVRWDGREPMVVSRLLGDLPRLFTSSGLGDHFAEGVRRDLFDELFAGPPESWTAAQDDFHLHRWPGCEHLSVNMSRADARTVSYSVIEIFATGASFAYHPDAPDAPAVRVTVHLPLAQGAA